MSTINQKEKIMNKFKQFFYRYQTEITWFLIGWLTLSGFQDLGHGNYLGAVISFGFAYINYALNR
jgi:hypothetical protein